MKTIKLINNNTGFDCNGCMFDTDGHGCGVTVEALQIGDCDINTVFIEEESND